MFDEFVAWCCHYTTVEKGEGGYYPRDSLSALAKLRWNYITSRKTASPAPSTPPKTERPRPLHFQHWSNITTELLSINLSIIYLNDIKIKQKYGYSKETTFPSRIFVLGTPLSQESSQWLQTQTNTVKTGTVLNGFLMQQYGSDYTWVENDPPPPTTLKNWG